MLMGRMLMGRMLIGCLIVAAIVPCVATTVAQAEPSGSRSVADSRGRDWLVYGHDYSKHAHERARAHHQP